MSKLPAHSCQLRAPDAICHQLQLRQAVPVPADAATQRALVLLPDAAQQVGRLPCRHPPQGFLQRLLQQAIQSG